MKRRIVAIVLSMAMAITMLPATSLRAEQSVSTKAMERIVSPIDGQPKDNLDVYKRQGGSSEQEGSGNT